MSTKPTAESSGSRWRSRWNAPPASRRPDRGRDVDAGDTGRPRGGFYTLTAAGERQPVRFERDSDDLSPYVDRWRLRKR
ncbi:MULTISPECIES: hypothetical protein [Natrialbaceae]|uniref:hypothetical protein n=1 Tax=Natrialbaceae TaxID=1644061 RepID=UPI00207CE649|nr:hypothetical protein [Natronococcus sp. CG52]